MYIHTCMCELVNRYRSISRPEMDTNADSLSCLWRQLRQSSEVSDLIRCLRGGASGSDDWQPGSAVADLVERIEQTSEEDGDSYIMTATALMEIAHEKLYTGKWSAVPQMWRDGKSEVARGGDINQSGGGGERCCCLRCYKDSVYILIAIMTCLCQSSRVESSRVESSRVTREHV